MSREQATNQSKVSIPQVSQPLSGSFHYAIDPEEKLVLVSFGKKLTVQQIKRYSDLLQINPSFQPTYSEIVDLTQVEELDLQADEFLTLADKIDPFSTDAKRAFVVRTSVQNHAARMHKVLRTQRNIEIFRSMEEAERWIATSS
ncbi:MAG TPA: hypothetical protein VH350_07045 [Candidatus Sulfotelmatobacter sp.]|nr:hypothetical protein [Candidatus Sulfotelmatobacter sp.]